MEKKNMYQKLSLWINLKQKVYSYILILVNRFSSIKEYKKTKERLEYLEFFKLTYLMDILFTKILLMYLKIKLFTRVIFFSKYRVSDSIWHFYFKENSQKKLSSILFSGIRYLWISLRFWIIGIILFAIAVYYFSYIRLLPFNKVIMEWLLIVMFLYWVLSGFVFFIKKYQYSKFTSVIQRFWKRSYILFWLIEGGIFLCFFYLTLNASEEPVYMYDQMKIYKQHLFSWRYFIIKAIPSIVIIWLVHYLQLILKWNTYYRQCVVMLLITLLLLFIVWLEFYQFFHIINFYGNLNWTYDPEDFLWNLDIETRKTRLYNNYISICLLAKFWHLIFIFVFWIFFVLRVNEIERIRHPLLAANSQNFIFLYMMTWLYMTPWLKFTLRKNLDNSYYWFFTNMRTIGLKLFLADLKLFITAWLAYLPALPLSFNFSYNFDWDFFYWIQTSEVVDHNEYRKFVVRNLLIKQLNQNA